MGTRAAENGPDVSESMFSVIIKATEHAPFFSRNHGLSPIRRVQCQKAPGRELRPIFSSNIVLLLRKSSLGQTIHECRAGCGSLLQLSLPNSASDLHQGEAMPRSTNLDELIQCPAAHNQSSALMARTSVGPGLREPARRLTTLADAILCASAPSSGPAVHKRHPRRQLALSRSSQFSLISGFLHCAFPQSGITLIGLKNVFVVRDRE